MGFLPELAAIAALVAASVSLITRTEPRHSLALLVTSVGSLWASVVALVAALLREDTSLRYVVEQTRPATSWTRRLTGLWSGAEGSLLLYVAIVGIVLLIGHRQAPAWQRAGSSLVVAVLSGAVARGADPFERVDLPPPGGVGMAPILEHGAMLVHPPLLYAGTALALAPGLVRSGRTARRLAHAALGLLTASLALGASWAYVELGWGGWWAWDPIENVGLVVWLLLAGGLHGDLVDRSGEAADGASPVVDAPMGRWAIVWLAACWPAVFAGAALTRTSLRTSVHAFADAAELAIWLWPVVVVAAVGAVIRMREAAGTSPHAASVTGPDDGVSTWPMWAPVVLLAAATLVVSLGTWRPFVGGDGTEGWFYSRALFPVAVVGAVLLGLAPIVRRSVPRPTVIPAAAGAVVGALLTIVVGATAWYQLVLSAALASGAALVVADARVSLRRSLAHAGLLCVLAGALGGTAGSDALVTLAAGEATSVPGHEIALERVDVTSVEPVRVTAVVVVDDTVRLEPSVTRYVDRGLRLPEIATHTRPWRDVQVILRTVDDQGAAVLTIRTRPLTQLVWWGAVLVTAAGLLGAVERGIQRRRMRR